MEMICDGRGVFGFWGRYCIGVLVYILYRHNVVGEGCKLYGSDIWRRNVMRRYVLGDTQ